ncbi:MAG: M28 family peptidase, partial [Thermoanaerobaculia bacterium]
EWQGGLPFTYHVGPGPSKIRLRVENEDTVRTMRNVVAVIPGTEEPERWVIAGNHRDAWIYGAKDPSSGTATLLEAARALGAAVEQGFRPKRTIVFTNWDAEEDLLGGSTSWVRDHRQKLIDDGVLYVNLDSSASGPDFHGGATPALADFLREVTKTVEHPDGPGSVHDQWASRAADGVPEVETIVGATDYTAFQENVGMSCIDMYSDGPYGVYHSQYDNFFWMSRIADPGFQYNTYMSRLLAVLLWRMANAEVLPLRSSAYARIVLDHLTEIEDKAAPLREISLDAARAAAERWLSVAEAFEDRLDRKLASEPGIAPGTSKRVNQLLMGVERAMTEPSGLSTRPFFKHLIYAPQPTYRAEVLPRIFEAIDSGAWNEIPTYEQQLVDAFDHAAKLVLQAEGLIEEARSRHDKARSNNKEPNP